MECSSGAFERWEVGENGWAGDGEALGSVYVRPEVEVARGSVEFFGVGDSSRSTRIIAGRACLESFW